MATKQSKDQKKTVERVMHEFKEGDLESGSGRKVKSRKQAVAIALSEAGASNQASSKENARNRRRTAARETSGDAGGDRKAGARGRSDAGRSKPELYAEARRRGLPGRSRMTKAELARALAH